LKKTIELKEGQVHYPKNPKEKNRHNHRRITGIVGDRIFYSAGGDKNFSCKRSSFIAWFGKKVKA